MAAGLEAQSVHPIAGTVYTDPPALALPTHLVPAAGVTVKLFRDGGDGAPSADDVPVSTAQTNAAGKYMFPAAHGPHWLVVDSRTFAADAWPEQTIGPAGSLCARPSGDTVEILFEGSCFGGRTRGSDDASSAVTAEHIARVVPGAPPANFAFSFNAVTTTADGPRVQGSLRQFVANANVRKGDNHMRFVPVEPANETRNLVVGVSRNWWSMTLATPLPPLVGAGTTIDGAAWNFLSPTSRSDTNAGRRGEAATVRAGERDVQRLEYPELELRFSGGEAIVCDASCSIRALAMNGAATSIVARADATIEQVLIGASADATPSDTRGTTGVQVERGTTVARVLLVDGQTESGIIVGPGARIDAEGIEVTHCGAPQAGGGIVLLSDSSSIRSSSIVANDGVGFLLGAPNGSAPANSNRIEGCTISSNQAGAVIVPPSSRNTIIRNDIMWNRVGGITTVAVEGVMAARENRFSANRFSENGIRPIVLDDSVAAAAPGPTCVPDPKRANGGISAPEIVSVRVAETDAAARVVVSGRACAGTIVEIYQSHDVPEDRAETESREAEETQLPSVGEFNYLGATNAGPDGTFEASFPLTVVRDSDRLGEIGEIWATDLLRASDLDDRGFSATAIDPAGNTSEMSGGVSAR